MTKKFPPRLSLRTATGTTKRTAMQAYNENGKRKRRRGSLAAELARDAQVSLHKAKQTIKVMKEAPELIPLVANGDVSLSECVELIKNAPQLIPHVISGKLNLAELRGVRPSTDEAEPEDFEKKVTRSFKRWLAQWPKEKRKEVEAIITMID